MIELRALQQLDLADFKQVAGGYVSDSRYVVTYSEREGGISFDLRLVSLNQPFVKKWDYHDDTLQRYARVLSENFSFGAYDGERLVGLVIAEAHAWNHSLWVWEFHVSEGDRNQGIGKRLMERVALKAESSSLRTIVCETQNTNATAIIVYHKLGFHVEGIDISYYSNHDYPDGEIALFMKRRLPSMPDEA